jgi:hypothetical protein
VSKISAIKPYVVSSHAFGQHPTATSEAVANCLEVTVFEMLDHHEEHYCIFYPLVNRNGTLLCPTA